MATKKRSQGTLTRVGKTVKSAAKTVAKKAQKAVKPVTNALTPHRKNSSKKRTAKSGRR
jgi:hypothetical protein